MQNIKHAIIAAAGLGSRLGFGLPKCMVEVAGHRVIEYQLKLLKDVEDVRIIVGYNASDVIDFVKSIRKDIRFVINKDYESTTTLQSFYMGAVGVNEPYLILDGDTIFKESTFNTFVDYCKNNINVIGIARSTTEDAVFVDVAEHEGTMLLNEFSRDKKNTFEWSNLAFLSQDILKNERTYVFECLQRYLPLKAFEIERLEIDTINEWKYAEMVLKEEANYCRL